MENAIHVYNVYVNWSEPKVMPDYYEAKLNNLYNEFNYTVMITGVSSISYKIIHIFETLIRK